MCCREQGYETVNNNGAIRINRNFDTSKPYDVELTLKLIVVGDSGAGKTQLLNRLVDNAFSTHDGPTIGIEYKAFFLDVDDRRFKIIMWDTAGQERYRAITRSYYRQTHAVMLVFDLAHQLTFENLKHWRAEVMNDSPEAIIIVVGCKADLVQTHGSVHYESKPLNLKERVDTTELDFLMESNSTYVEVSSKENIGFRELKKALAGAARTIMHRENKKAHERTLRNKSMS
jgi:Ras-related protein Rab-14